MAGGFGAQRRAGDWRDVALLLAATLFVRAVVFALTNNENGDPDARALWAAELHHTPQWITSGFWLPLQPYAIAAMMYLIPDPALAGRLLSAVCGVASIVPFWYLVRLYFDRPVAILAGGLFAIYGNHVGLSLVAMTEAPFVLFALWGTYLFAREMQSDRPRLSRFCVAGLLLSIAGGLRHEAWQLTGILMLWMLADSRTRWHVLLFAPIGFSFYLLWTLGNVLAGNGVMYALTGVASQKAKELEAGADYSVLLNMLKWGWIFVQSPGPLVTLLGALGLLLAAWKRWWPIHLGAIAVLMIAPYFLLSAIKAEWLPQHRYVVMPVILLFPYAAAVLWRWASRLRAPMVAVVAVLVVTLATQGMAYTRHSRLGLPVKDYKAADVLVWQWLRDNLSADDRIVVEDLDWRSPGILLRSGHYTKPYETVFPFEPPQRLQQVIASVDATVLVLASDRSKWPFLQAMDAKELYRNDDYVVLRIRGARR